MKEYTCKICNKTFTRAQNLIFHSLKHNKERAKTNSQEQKNEKREDKIMEKIEKDEIRQIVRQELGYIEKEKDLTQKLSQTCEDLSCVRKEIEKLKSEIPAITQKTVQREISPLENQMRELRVKIRPKKQYDEEPESAHVTLVQLQRVIDCPGCRPVLTRSVIKNKEKFANMLCKDEECRRELIKTIEGLGYEIKERKKSKPII